MSETSKQSAEKSVPCAYAPFCTDKFTTNARRNRHCISAHGGIGKLYCIKCPTLKFFASKKSLAQHMSEHQSDGICSYCSKTYAGSYLRKHMRQCSMNNDNDGESKSTEVEMEDPVSRDDGRPIYRPQPTGQTRSSRAAPRSIELDTRLVAFVDWIKSPSAAGKKALISNHDQFFMKFRTVLGKLSKFHNKSVETLFYHLNRTDSCLKMFGAAKLSEFTMWLGKGDDGRQLSLRTVYNYLRTLVLFFQWKVLALGMSQFAKALETLEGVCKNLSIQKDKMATDITQKAARLDKLPKIPDFLAYMKETLKPAVDEVRDQMNSSRERHISQYMTCRNYILMALLFGAPPQRKQFLEELADDNVTYEGDYTILKVEKHKTQRRYGAIVVALPPFFYQAFQMLVDLLNSFRVEGCHKLFIGYDGRADKYLTKALQSLTNAAFGKDVTIRDCRSIFINYAKSHLDLQGMYELSRQMCHSFQVQQSEYRADDSVQRAIRSLKSLHATHQWTEMIPLLCDSNLQAIDEDDTDIIIGEEAEESKTSNDIEDDLPDEAYIQFLDSYNAENSTQF